MTSDLSWKWGTAENFDFLPRVAMGNIVFSLARWRVAMEEAQRLWQVLEGERLHAVQEWRKAKSIPRFAYITELDFHLLIDFENSLSVETCLEYMRKQPETILEEMFPGPGELPVHGPEGRFVHEVVIPFVRRKRSTVSLRGETAQHSPVGRPGAGWSENIASDSEWLFAKLYCSPSHADRLLLELVNPLVKEVLTPALAEGWFFVRYGDPRWHLRLRIHGDPSILKDQVLPRLNRFSEQMMRRGTLWRLQFGTYDREVYRYGGPRAIDVAERLFQFDSELCLELLPLTSGDAGATLRWQMAFRGIDTILSGLGLTLKQKHALIEEAAAVYEENFIVNRVFKKLLAQKFRDHRRTLAAILGGHDTGLANPLPLQATASFARFSEKVQSIRTQLEGLRQAKELTGTISYLAASFVHMHLNRLFRSSHAQQEAVLYRMLARTYASKIARDKPEPEA